MAGLTNYASKAALDNLFPVTGGTSYIAWSTNGTTEAAIIARTAIGATGWAAATSADPSVKANANALTSGASTGTGTVTHFAIFDAVSAGNQMTDWTALAVSKLVGTGDQLTAAIGDFKVTLT
jgi:hypothetical protein